MLDYSTAAAVAAAPRIMDLPAPASRLFETLAGGYTALSVRRVVPFKGHGAAELAIGLALPAMPWLLGFADNRAARNLCFGITALTLVVAALTDWNGAGARRPRRSGRARR
jgi:hypothetical protein